MMTLEKIGQISQWHCPPLIFTGLVYHFQDLFLKVKCKSQIKVFILNEWLADWILFVDYGFS